MSSEFPPRRLARAEGVLAYRHGKMCVVLEDAHDRHNISAVLRTCEAFGIQNIHIVNELQPMVPVNKGVSMGSHRWLTIEQHEGTPNAIRVLRQRGYKIYVALLSEDALPLPQLPRDSKAAYVFGNEHAGVTQGWVEAADQTFLIPTSGFSGSLNLSVAAAVTIYDRLLGKPEAALPQGDLSDTEKHDLRQQWYRSLAHGSQEVWEQYERHVESPPEPRLVFPEDQHGSTETR